MMWPYSASLLPALLLSIVGGAGAQAVTGRVRSVFTALEAGDCIAVDAKSTSSAMRCPGIGGLHVLHEQTGGRTYLTFAPEHGNAGARSARRSLAASNFVIGPERRRAMIEWRVSRPEGKPIPYATIVRYVTAADGRRGEVLVVSKVGAGGSCHVAYVDALANRDAIVVAREIADGRARQFDCSKPPTVEGQRGRSPM
jgi:hypothetical protein